MRTCQLDSFTSAIPRALERWDIKASEYPKDALLKSSCAISAAYLDAVVPGMPVSLFVLWEGDVSLIRGSDWISTSIAFARSYPEWNAVSSPCWHEKRRHCFSEGIFHHKLRDGNEPARRQKCFRVGGFYQQLFAVSFASLRNASWPAARQMRVDECPVNYPDPLSFEHPTCIVASNAGTWLRYVHYDSCFAHTGLLSSKLHTSDATSSDSQYKWRPRYPRWISVEWFDRFVVFMCGIDAHWQHFKDCLRTLLH